MRAVVLVCIVCITATITSVRADLAPMPHPGYSLAPRTETRVRMARERVDIEIGQRPYREYYMHLAEVAATFEMVNDTGDTVTIDVGFPVEAEFYDHLDSSVTDEIMAREAREQFGAVGWYQFRASIDGGDEFAPEAIRARAMLAGPGHGPCLWFHWTMSFAPGTTRVDVSYRIPSIYSSKGTAYQSVGYILQSGALWAGTIDTAVIAVHFPQSAPPVHPGSRSTPFFEHTDHTVTWTYHDLEPGPQHDITVEFIPPDVARVIHDLADHLLATPDDVDAMVELARLESDAVPRGNDVPDRPVFAATPGDLLEHALDVEPGNCTTWYVYLCWYHGMRDSRLGFDYYRTETGEPRLRQLERAHDACPDDPGVSVWYESLHPDESGLDMVSHDPDFKRWAAQRIESYDREFQKAHPMAIKRVGLTD